MTMFWYQEDEVVYPWLEHVKVLDLELMDIKVNIKDKNLKNLQHYITSDEP